MVIQNLNEGDPKEIDKETMLVTQLRSVLSEAVAFHKSASACSLAATAEPEISLSEIALLGMVSAQSKFLEALTFSLELSQLYQRSAAVSLQKLLPLITMLAKKGT